MDISLEQLQTHLLKVSQQVTNQQEHIKVLAEDAQASRDMLESLLRHLTTNKKPQFEHEFAERHIELSERLEHNESQLAEFGENFSGYLKNLRERVDNLAQKVSSFGEKINHVGSFEQLESLKNDLIASSSGLVQESHFEQAIKDIDKRLSKLVRTQFKTNSLSESQTKHVEQALDTLQDLGVRRDAREQSFFEEIRQEKEQIYQEARGEFAVALLPALDGLEAALSSGERFIKNKKISFDLPKDKVNDLMPDPPKAPESADKGRGLFARRSDETYQRDFQKYKEEEKVFKRLVKLKDDLEAIYSQSFTSALGTELKHNQGALSGWLEGLNLVRERFIQLLNEEGIVTVEPLGKNFDPHLHTAIEVVERDDITPNTVIEVIRKGYKHGERVLRYPEVVVARAKRVAESIEEPELLQGTQDLPSVEIAEDAEGGLLTELDRGEQGEAVELTAPETIEDFMFPAEETMGENLVDLLGVSQDEFDRQHDSRDELVETSTDNLEPSYTSEELAQLIEQSKTPALEILPTELDNELPDNEIEKQKEVTELFTDSFSEDPTVGEIESLHTTSNKSRVEKLSESSEIDSEATTSLRTTEDVAEISGSKEFSSELQQDGFEVAGEEAIEANVREVFWEEPLESTSETEASEIPLTVPESAREQALKEISWQLPAKNTQDTLQENADEKREKDKEASSQESVVKNKLKTALELAEGKFNEGEIIKQSSENSDRDENINQPENE